VATQGATGTAGEHLCESSGYGRRASHDGAHAVQLVGLIVQVCHATPGRLGNPNQSEPAPVANSLQQPTNGFRVDLAPAGADVGPADDLRRAT
jgi:hypothetical protein